MVSGSSKLTVGEYIKKMQAKGKLTPKRRAFARAVVRTKSKSLAYLETHDVGPDTALATVHQEASRTASIPAVKQEIERLFSKNGLELDDVVSIHKRNMMQEEHLPTSQRAVGDYYELAGMKASASAPSVAVSFVINRTDTNTHAPASANHASARVIDSNADEGVEVRTITPRTPLGTVLTEAHKNIKNISDDDSLNDIDGQPQA